MTQVQIYRLREVARRVGLSADTIKRKAKAGDFPKPIKLGKEKQAAIGWTSASIDDWIAQRVAASNVPEA
ncbi:MAG TPA: AlpA family phage regulatory protein [Noviherbaspirillum sp.]